MALYKIKGDKRVKLTSEEEQFIRDQWSESDIYKQANKYKSDRIEEYPKINDLVVALWEKIVESRSDYADALELERQAVKAKYPKPE